MNSTRDMDDEMTQKDNLCPGFMPGHFFKKENKQTLVIFVDTENFTKESMSEIQSTYYHSPIGLLKISGTDDYITEVVFYDKVQKIDARKKNLSPMLIQCL